MASLPAVLYEPTVRAALAEDLGTAGDLTSDAAIPEDARATADIVARLYQRGHTGPLWEYLIR